MEPILNDDQFRRLQNEYYILHLIYHRNKNQHRMSIWWKYLNILHRYIRKILKLSIDSNSVTASKIKGKHHKIQEIVNYLIGKNVITKAYYEFNGIIALGQFLSLGLTLTGALGRVWSILNQVKERYNGLSGSLMMRSNEKSATDSTIVIEGDEDIGENIEVIEEHDSTTIRREKVVQSSGPSIVNIESNNDKRLRVSKKKKKKSSKRRTSIDDIFG